MSLVWAHTIAENNFIGTWHGNIAIGPQSLPIVFNIKEGDSEYLATMDSPAQGAKDIKADIVIDSDKINITIPSIGAQYTGEYADGKILGRFSQRGISLVLNLEPGEYLPPRPQTPQPPFVYETRQVSILNPIDSAELSATLTLPIQYHMPIKMGQTFPLVVMVTGSGQQNRDEEVFGHHPFAVIAHHLALNGIMSLRYDDRGFGSSTGNLADATTETFATDAQAVVDWARKNVERVGSVGVLGHSEGGTIAFILASKGTADFIVTIGAPAVRGDEILLMQNRALMGQGAEFDECITALGRVFDYLIDNPGANEWSNLDNAISDLTLISQPLKDNLHKIVTTNNPWLSQFISYDPTNDISNIRIPVMALNGSLDKQVDASQNLNALRRLLPENHRNIIKEYYGLNHLMQHAVTGMPTEYSAIEETIAPEVLNDITTWINNIVKYAE